MLYDRILKLKQQATTITTSPVLNAFNMEECCQLDAAYSHDPFIKDKVDKCLNYLAGLLIDFHPNYRSAYEEYNEAMTYVRLSKKYNTTRIPESGMPTPDFHIVEEGEYPFDLYVEVKALSFLDGNLNYKAAQESSLKANIGIEEQLKSGKKIAFGETIISPFLKQNELPTTKGLIEIYIDKIRNNIKKEQYNLGDTVLLIDIKQLLLEGRWDESGIAIYQEGFMKSMVSGALWHTAFGRMGDRIYKPIEFEGQTNMDDPLQRIGILVDHLYIKGLIFAVYENFEERKYLGFFRSKEGDSPAANFIASFCDMHNDDQNTEAWRVLQGTAK